jgi:hypothetical protein
MFRNLLQASVFLLLLQTMCLPGYCQFSGGAADGHSNLRISNITCIVVNVNPFKGGSGDGHANITLTNITCTPINANPFAGGIGEGHSNLRLTNITCTAVNSNPFLGGAGGGSVSSNLINMICVTVNANPFLGGTGDGHAEINLTNVTCVPVNANPFLGGIGDGNASSTLLNIICTAVNVNPYRGGFADGHANIRLVNTSCAVVNVNPFLGGIASGYCIKGITNILCGATSLPIGLISFSARPDDNKVYLTWETATETNNDFFTVERSVEGSMFEKVLTKKGAGNSNVPVYYEAVDEKPFRGVSYYRLRQTDYDGNYSFSEIMRINFIRETATNIAPNPVTEEKNLMLSFESPANDELNISIHNALGILIYTFSVPAVIGENNIPLKVPFLNNGMYFVDIKSSAETETLKLLVNK